MKKVLEGQPFEKLDRYNRQLLVIQKIIDQVRLSPDAIEAWEEVVQRERAALMKLRDIEHPGRVFKVPKHLLPKRGGR